MKGTANKRQTTAKEEEKSMANSIVSVVDTTVPEVESVPKNIGPTADFNDCEVDCENHDSDCEQVDEYVSEEIPVEVIFEDNFEEMINTDISMEENITDHM